MLLTGFGPFGGTRDNPTGDFVTHVENIDAAMKLGFGERLHTDFARVISKPNAAPILEYIVEHEGRLRHAYVRPERLDVTDDELNPAVDDSIPEAFVEFEPHAVLSMGVHGAAQYAIEWHADNGGLRWPPLAPAEHDWSVQPTENLRPNYSLARAIGAQTPDGPPIG
jgi:hypothetical protein